MATTPKGAVARTRRGTFKSTLTIARLYEIVGLAAKHVRPAKPQLLSVREFNSCRTEIDKDCPTAAAIMMRLNSPWPTIVQVALDEQRSVTMTDAAARRAPANDWLTLRHSYYALQRVATHLGVDSFSEGDYSAAREQLLLADQKRNGNASILRINLPSSGQIVQVTLRELGEHADEQLTGIPKSRIWNDSLNFAGLKPYKQKQSKGLTLEQIHRADREAASDWLKRHRRLRTPCRGERDGQHQAKRASSSDQSRSHSPRSRRTAIANRNLGARHARPGDDRPRQRARG